MTKRSKRRARLVAAGLAGKRGAEPSVTLEVVKRVGQRMSKGLPLTYALALEDDDISVDCFQKALERNPKLSAHLARWKAQFIADACDLLASGDTADLKWLLARRHPDLFGEKKEETAGGGDATAAGLQELINRSRELARIKAAGGE